MSNANQNAQQNQGDQKSGTEHKQGQQTQSPGQGGQQGDKSGQTSPTQK